MFKQVRPSMTGLGFVSESDQNYDQKADPRIKAAVERARKTGTLTSEQAEKNLGATPEIKAKYKIEVMFDHKRTTAGPNLCGIQLWESGKKFHGGGDELMYWCKIADSQTNEGCGSPISSDHMRGPVAICPGCGRAIKLEAASNMRVVRLPTKKLAEELEKIFRSLGSNADIYVKYHKTDIHYIAMERKKGPAVARKLKGMHIYPLKNILKDTAAGSDVAVKFHTFLTA